MTVSVGRRSLTLGWPIAVPLFLALITGSVKGTLFVNGILETQTRIEHKLDLLSRLDTARDIRINQNTADLTAIKPEIVYLDTRTKALESILPAKVKMRYYTEIRTNNGVVFKPVP